MTGIAALGPLLAAAAAAGWMIGALGAALCIRWLQSDEISPGSRCTRVEWIAPLPLAGAMLGIGVLLAPALLKLFGWIDDHCLGHGGLHPHFCLRHLPAALAHWGVWCAASVGLVPLLGLIRWIGVRGREAHELARIQGMMESGSRLVVTETAELQAFMFGIRRPRIVISAGLRRLLTPAEQRAVVRHEIAHARNGDPLRRFGLGLMLALHLPGPRTQLWLHWQRAAEERADDAVIARGQGLSLASALLKIARRPVPGLGLGSLAPAAATGPLAHRIRRLAGPVCEVRGQPLLEGFLGGLILALSALLLVRHHALETAAGWLLGA